MVGLLVSKLSVAVEDAVHGSRHSRGLAGACHRAVDFIHFRKVAATIQLDEE